MCWKVWPGIRELIYWKWNQAILVGYYVKPYVGGRHMRLRVVERSAGGTRGSRVASRH